MKRRNVTVSLFLLLLLFVAFLVRRWNEPRRKEAFDRDPPLLLYANEALCQMDCRQISKEEIKEIMKKGIINFNRSNRRGNPCPTFALQGSTAGGKSLLVNFGQCKNKTTVLFCFNLQKDLDCDCSANIKKEGR